MHFLKKRYWWKIAWNHHLHDIIIYLKSSFIMLPKKELGRLQTIINRAVRVVFNLPQRVPTSEYLKRLRWLPIGPRIDHKHLTLAHKAIVYKEPSYLSELLRTDDNRSDVSRVGPKLMIPTPGHYAISQRSFAQSAPRIYMKLPVTTRELSCKSFSRAAKTFLFTEAYDHPLDSILSYTPSSGPFTYKFWASINDVFWFLCLPD